MATLTQQLQRIWHAYEKENDSIPASAHDVAEWAVRSGLWKPRPSDVIHQCASALADALRQEYFTDSKGRRVRAMHAARTKRRGEQLVLWADMRIAPREHMDLAFKQRRKQIVGDCHQLKIDVDSYNDNHPDESSIQLVFNFERDLEELELKPEAA